ncbi:unnamed protein product [Spirodela intermedia]|uniref:Carboxypeptidase n=1 Tax=Spirodela intermedia TaxID=51605 RepID=A0A7I8L847_SPIIN|nr:unnamed protein product [Spirodela intermedia]
MQRGDAAGLVAEGKTVTAGRFDSSKVLPQKGLKEKDKITKLPGQPAAGVDFEQYSGYVTVDEKAGRALFYYLVEAPDAAKRPLLVWFNGGPGCSSLGIGALEEIGPFRVMSDGKTLFSNPFAWNRVANVLFLESPAGVGFSYSNTTSDYDSNGDTQTAEDAYVFLVNWLERFPEYKHRDLFLAGESYAGHFAPQLAHAILRYNNQLPHGIVINLKGIAIGNAAINDLTDNKGMLDFFWTHALISDENHREIEQNCDFNVAEGIKNPKCDAAIEKAKLVMTQIDIYNIYGPLCYNTSLVDPPKKSSVKSSDPCIDYYVFEYLNNPAVQKALHAISAGPDHPWMICNDFSWEDTVPSVLPALKELTANGIQVLVYSGDVDGRVPVTSSRYSVNALKLPVKTPWHPWLVAQQAAGYVEVYEGNLTLVTVRGGGHQVPSSQPHRALVLIKYFLQGEPLPPYPLLQS